MGVLVLFIFYGSILFFLVTCLIKIYKYFKLPLPLRSEIFKGGSIYETYDWWPKNETCYRAKLKTTFRDFLVQEGYYRHNRNFWFVQYPFHLGIYLLVLWHIWLAIFSLAFPDTHNLGYALIWCYTATGLMFIGAVGILIRRIFDKKLRVSYPRWNYLKWAFIILAIGSGFFIVQYHFSGSVADLVTYISGQYTLDLQNSLNPPIWTSIHVLTVAGVLVYLPFNHLLRLIFRYLYKLRWDSIPSIVGGRVDKVIREQLQYPVVWSASHVPAVKRWKDV
jgi:nitrate reductase gamma subunit